MSERLVPTIEIPPLPEIAVRREPILEKVHAVLPHFRYLDDDEAIEMLGLAIGHPEWREELLRQIRNEKPHIQNPEEIIDNINTAIASIPEKSIPANEIAQWENDLQEVQHRIAKLFEFFDPLRKCGIKRVQIIPSNDMLQEESGGSFHVAGEALIMSRSGALKNVEHEFLHGIINPIIERLWPTLSVEDIEKINRMANEKLAADYNTPESIVMEELIRTYNHYFEEGQEPEKSNQLRSKIYELFTEFQKAKQINKVLSFEDFLIKNQKIIFG